jgi:hypothetical protein
MLTCFIQGGLGNQLFQIFTTISHADRCNIPFYFKKSPLSGDIDNGTTIRHTYWSTILYSMNPFLKPDYISSYSILYETTFTFNNLQIIQPKSGSYIMLGYYQSYKYFDHIKSRLFRLIQLDKHKQLVSIRNKMNYANIISIHFRIGDYVKYPHIYPILTETYYINALKYIFQNRNLINQITDINQLDYIHQRYYKVLYFCETDDVPNVLRIINILQSTFPHIEFELINPEIPDWEQLICMSLCSHNVIANSMFSWWSAYFNSNPNKIVCYPSKWFNNNNVDTKDLFLNDWIKINSE